MTCAVSALLTLLSLASVLCACLVFRDVPDAVREMWRRTDREGWGQ